MVSTVPTRKPVKSATVRRSWRNERVSMAEGTANAPLTVMTYGEQLDDRAASGAPRAEAKRSAPR